MKKELGIFLLLVALCATVAVINPRFLSASNLMNVSSLIGIYGIFSIGLGLVIITGGIDLSVGSVFALQGVLLAILLREYHWPWPLAVLTTLVVVIALGAFHGFSIAKLRMQPFIVTLCGLLFYRGLARYIADDSTEGFGNAEDFGLLNTLATGRIASVPMPFILLIVVAIASFILLHKSVYGRYLIAIGRNEDATRYSGINTRLVVGSVYAVSMLFAGISGILFAFYTNSISPAQHGTAYELYGIAAAVLGGCSLRGGEGSILGIVIGTALLQVLQNAVNLLGIKSSLNFCVLGAVIFLGVLADQLISNRKRSRSKS
jgi:ribose transport system permease protein